MKLYRCANCDFETDEPGDCRDISDFWGRVTPGEIMPEGECPDCGALVHCYDAEFLEKMAASSLLNAVESCLHQLCTDSDLETISGAAKYQFLSDLCRSALALADPSHPAIQGAAAPSTQFVTVEVCGGVVQDVVGLPEGWKCRIHDFDDDPDDCVDEADYEGTGCGRGDFPAMSQDMG